MTRKICVVTGSRAEYGLLRWLMQKINRCDDATLQLVVAGMHLSPEFGLTYSEIERDGFNIDRKVEMLISSDTPIGISKSMGLGMIGFSDAYAELAPDLIVVLGDRFEIFSAVAAALVANIPVAHIHGGEATEGAMDDAMRHSITKMSHLHFVAAEPYRKRVIQLGEHPERVYTVGALGLDGIAHLTLLSRNQLEAELGFNFKEKNLLVTFHPVTLEHGRAAIQVEELLLALADLNNTGIIFTLPNADTDSRVVIKMIREFTSKNRNARCYPSLGQLHYLSCMRECDGVLGNSSSGLIEAPTLKCGTINIGDRQKGRLQADSVLNCPPQKENILASIHQLYSPQFRAVVNSTKNPYGQAGASSRVFSVIRDYPLAGVTKKHFHDFA
jgi:GDP/UDP-N,N'-diacetylbacillosamine 2-epimerase (hydrolysing)